MSINKNTKNVKPVSPELKPELISWDEPVILPPSSKENTLKSRYFHYIVLLIGFLLSGSFFFAGRMSKDSSLAEPLGVSYENVIDESSQTASAVSATQNSSSVGTKMPKTQKVVPTPNVNGEVIGSKSGKKYYFPWCGTVKRIKLENQVHFANIRAAKDAGFTPGGNCKGIF